MTGAAVSVGPSASEGAPEVPRDTRRCRRILAAVLMPVGPAAVAVLRLFAQDDTVIGERIAADPGAQWGWAVLGWVALFTLLPGTYAALHVVRRHEPVLTAWTAALLVPGYLGMTALGAMEASAWAGLQIGLTPVQASRLADQTMGSPTVLVPGLIFVFGHIVGTILLGIVAIRARFMPVWFGVVFAASQVVHLIATIGGLPWLDFLGWGITAIGMGLLGWRALRMSDDEWDLPPLRRGV